MVAAKWLAPASAPGGSRRMLSWRITACTGCPGARPGRAPATIERSPPSSATTVRSASLPAPAEAEGDVLEHGHVREERVRLEDQAEVPPMDGHPRDVLPREDDLAAVGLDEPGDHPEQRALAAARGPEEGEKLAGGGVEGHLFDRDDGAERLAKPAHAEPRRGAAHRRRLAPRGARITARSPAPSPPT